MKHLLCSIFIIVLTVSFPKAQNDTTEIILLHTNDMHSKIDNFAKFAAFVQKYKNEHENVFVISAGDLFTGNPINDQYEQRGWPIVDLMNRIPYDLTCLGNHEFDYGQSELNYLISHSAFPYICANIHISEDAVLQRMKKYHTLHTQNGISIGFPALIQIGDNMMPATNPAKLGGISFSDPMITAAEYKTYKDSSDILIALTHLGYEQDVQLAETHPFFDVIIGGHSHTKLHSGKTVNNVLITQAGSYMDYAGVLTLKYYKGNLIFKKDTLIDIANYPEYNQEIKNIIDNYNNNPVYKEILAHSEYDISGTDELGALITDAMEDTLKTDISFVNNGGIRLHKIQAGDITIKQVYELSPFCNTYIIFKLKPKQIKELIHYTFQLYNNNELQVNGLNIEMYVKDNELVNIVLKDKEGKKLKNKTYTVAVNNYMATSYKLDFFKKGKETNIVDSESLIQYLKKRNRLNYKGVQRIKTLNAEQIK